MKMVAGYGSQSWTQGTSATDKGLAQEWLNCWHGASSQTLVGPSCKLTFAVTTSNATTAWASPSVTCVTMTNTGDIPVGLPIVPPHPALPAEESRRRAPLAFSPYINATELVVEFLAEARRRIPGLTRERFLRLTIADFFAFLIRRAAETDGVAPPEMATAEIQIPISQLRCGWCGRFLPRAFELLRMYHCGVPCLERAALRDGIVLPT